MADVALPSGTVTFLFTDIEGSTKLWEAHPEEMRVALARHDALLRKVFAENGGSVFKTIGDAFSVVFEDAHDALAAALASQIALQEQIWPVATPLLVRIAIHTGAVESRDNDYFGPPVNRVARLLSICHGGQTLLSQSSFALTQDRLPNLASTRALGEQVLKDLGRPESVYQLDHPSINLAHPPLRSPSGPKHNLVTQVTSFVGREVETKEIRALLAKSRLLTLLGSGGSGKTRLSLHLAASLVDQFPDGIWFAELAPLASPDLVAQTVADTLGAKEEPGKAMSQTLVENLRDKVSLVILDNCEHLLAASAELARDLLTQCPHLRVLTTSREPLRTAGEATYRVPPLSLPDLGSLQTQDSLNQYESVRLFIDRATVARPEFRVTNQNAPALAQVCSRLDGIPLAIELAAARMRSMSIEEVNSRLDQRFRILTGGSRNSLPRQQTLRSLIDWSYDILSVAEQKMLCRLSVFAGSWSLEAAEQICIGEGVEEWDVLDLVTSLSDKSLIVAEEKSGHTRYRLLESLRAYGIEAGGGEEGLKGVRQHHMVYYRDLAVSSTRELRGPDQVAWLDRLESEHDNFRAAITWGVSSGQISSALTLAGALGGIDRFWYVRGHLTEGRKLLTECLAASDQTSQAEHLVAEISRIELALTQGDAKDSIERGERILALSQSIQSRDCVLRAIKCLALVSRFQVRLDEAIERCHQALAICDPATETILVADLLRMKARCMTDQGKFPEGEEILQRAVRLYREIGDLKGLSFCIQSLGTLAHEKHQLEQAISLYREGEEIDRQLGYKRGVALALSNIGEALVNLGRLSEAREALTEGLLIRRKLGVKLGYAFSLENFAMLAKAEGDTERWARLCGAALAIREQMGAPLPPVSDHVTELLPPQIPDSAFTPAWEHGKRMGTEDALDYALTDSAAQTRM